jgi:hypothetical protein
MLWKALAGIVAGFVLLWLGLVAVLWLNRPSETTAREGVPLQPRDLRLTPASRQIRSTRSAG